jgi:cellulose synthase (UDP-forming)
VPLAAGTCPATLEDFLRQQYRRCWRAASLVWTRHMWRVPMPLAARLPYLTGWLGHLTSALRTLILPLIPIILLALAPEEISLRNGLLLVPAVLSAVVLCPLGQSSRYRPGTWALSLVMGWAQVLGLWDYARGRVLSRAQAAPGQGHAIRRFWWGVTTWNGGLAAAWIALALWRAVATGSGQFAIVAASGAGYLIVVGCLVVPGCVSPRAPTHLPFPLHGQPPAGRRGWPGSRWARCRTGAAAATPARQEA